MKPAGGNSAVVVSPVGTFIKPGDEIIWTPTKGAFGRLYGFSVKAYQDYGVGDNSPQTSVSAVDVNFNVGQVNARPIFTSAGTTLTGAFEDVPFIITYDRLLAAFPASDAESATLVYSIDSLPAGGGTYEKRSAAAAVTTPVVAGVTDLAPGDSLVWTPPANANGALNVMNIRVKDLDNNLSLATRTVTATVTAVNDAPSYTTATQRISPNANKNVDGLEITWAQIRAAIPAADLENDSLEFRVESVGTGTLKVTSSTSGATVTPVELYNMPRFAAATDAANKKYASFNWKAPVNVTGEVTVMTVRVCDAVECASSTRDVKIFIDGLNARPTISSSVSGSPASDVNLVLGVSPFANATISSGTQQNVPLRISHADLLALSNARDSDQTAIYLNLTHLDGGTVTMPDGTVLSTVGGLTPVRTLNPGEFILWTPSTNAKSDNSGLPAFRFVAFDNAESSLNTATVRVKVTPVNQPPTMASAVNYATGRNQALNITHASLASLLSLSDSDDATAALKFRIEDVISGTLQYKVGAGAAQTANVGQTIADGDSIVWTPNQNVTGAQVAFKISAEDAAGLRTAAIATVTVTVSGSNIAPTLALTQGGAVISDAKLAAVAIQGQSFRITYQNLADILPIQDTDSSGRFYVVTRITGGTLRRGAGTVDAQLNAPASAPDATKNQLLSVGEEFLFTPEASKFGLNTEILRVRGWDGENYSSEAIVRVDLNRVYSTPTLTSISDFTGLIQDQTFTFSYEDLRSRSDESNFDETPTERLKFKVVATSSGVLKRGGTTLTANALLSAGETFTWDPPLAAFGRLAGFSVVAYQENAGGGTIRESVVPLNVHFNVVKANATPTMAAGSTFSGAFEDVPFSISYDMLRSNYPGSDAEGSVLNYVVVSLPASSATYQKKSASGTTAFGSANLPVEIAPGESVIWTPAANQFGSALDVMTVKVKDTDGKLSDDSRMVKVNVANVNDIPTYTATLPLNAVSKNPAGGVQISFDDLKNKIQVFDQESTTDQIQYRVESVGAGKLYTGTSINAGNLVNTSNSMPVVSKTGAVTALTWEPDLNSFGNFTVMSIRAFDGTDYASTAVQVNITVNPTNTAPTVVAAFTSDGTGGTNASVQNGSAVVSYDTLLAKTQASDVDGNPLTFQISYLESGSLTVGGTTLSSVGTPSPMPTVGPGGWLVWRPASNVTGNAVAAFRVRAFDGALSSGETIVSVKVTAENQAPALAVNTTFAGTLNTKVEKTFDELAAALNVQDLEDVNPGTPQATRYNGIQLKVTQVLYGTLYVAGSTFDGSKITNVGTNANTIISSAAGQNKFYWEPPTDATSTIVDAFRVAVVDSNGTGLTSPMTATVKMSLSGSNLPPSFASTNKTFTNGTQDTRYTISFDTLASNPDANVNTAGLGLADADSPWVSFVVTNISGGTLMKGGTTLSAFTWPPAGGSTPAANNRFEKYETLTYLPTAGLTGTTQIMQVRAWDGVNFSSQVATVSVTLAAVNQFPTLTRVRDFLGATKDTDFTFSYDDLRGNPTITDGSQRTDAFDAEENLASKTLGFKVSDIVGSLARTAGAGGAGPFTGNNPLTIAPNDVMKWTPPNGQKGRILAFKVKALDAANQESAVAIPVYINVNDSNQPPTFLANSFLSGAKEDIPTVITYSMLASAYPGTDDNTSVLGYRIKSLTGISGSLTFNGAPATVGVTLMPGDYLIWTPAAHANSGVAGVTRFKLFDLSLVDGAGLETTATPVAVESTIAPVNDQPTYGTPVAFSAVAKNVAGGVTISHTLLAAKLPVSDIENDVISYRIESLGAGTLVRGPTNAGQAVNPMVSKPMLVSSGADGVNNISEVTWTPPLNGEGEFLVMTVRAFDGTDFAATTMDVKISVNPGDSKPTINAVSVVMGTTAGTSGTSQNGALPISYDTLLSRTSAADPDGNVVKFFINSIDGGSLTIGGVTHTSTAGKTLLVGPGESMVWRPAANLAGANLPAFKVQAFDGTQYSDNLATFQVKVDAINQAPSMVESSVTLSSGVRNTFHKVSFANLAAALKLRDVEDNAAASNDFTSSVMKIRIEQLAGGVEIRVGTQDLATNDESNLINNTSQLSDANRLIGVGKFVYWKPPVNQTGVYDAYRVTSVDSGGLSSAQMSLVRVDISSGANAAPVFAAATQTLNLGSSPQGRPITVTYDQLRAAMDLQDTDSAFRGFVITSTPNAALRKGTTLMTFETVAAGTPATPVPLSTSIIAPTESVVVFPTAGVTGNTTLFTVRGWDGENYSVNTTQGSVVANLTATNQIPTLTYVRDFTGVTLNTAFNFTYDQLRGNPANTGGNERTNAWDSEEALPTKTLRFRVKAATSGTLVKVKLSDSSTSAMNVGDSFDPADAATFSYRWTPPNGQTGIIEGFRVVAYDAADAESTSQIPVKFVVTAPNTAPVKVSESYLTGAREDVPFIISYDMLASKYVFSDDFTSTLRYRIKDLTGAAGTLTKNGVALVPPVTLLPGDTVVWTSAANANSGVTGVAPLFKAFTLEVVDDSNAASTPVDVNVSVDPVNDQPTIATGTADVQKLASEIAKNQAVTITHQMIYDVIKFRDLDFAADSNRSPAANISYRIESVGSGSLRKAAGGALINPSNLDASTMPRIVSSGNGNGNDQLESVYWTPALNAEYDQIVMSIRGYDGTDYSSSTVNVVISITAGNTVPTMTSKTLILGTSVVNSNLTSGTSQNGQLPIAYDTLRAFSGVTDPDDNPIWFKVESIDNGSSLKVNGQTYTAASLSGGSPAEILVKPSETIVWVPATNVKGNASPAFTLKARDDREATLTSGVLTVQANISAVNQLPTFNATNASMTFDAGASSRNTVVAIPFETIVAGTNPGGGAAPTGLQVYDLEDAPSTDRSLMRLQVVEISSGQGLYVGTGVDITTATQITSPSAPIGAGKKLFWIPPAGLAGTFAAFKVVAIDQANGSSPLVGTVNVTIQGSNAAPTINNASVSLNTVTGLASLTQGSPIVVSYDQLKALIGANDTDSVMMNLVLTSISNSVIKKSGTTMVATADTSAAPVAASILGAGESLVIYPNPSVSGVQTVMTVTAWDGEKYPTGTPAPSATVTANLTKVNQQPGLSFVKDFTGGVAGGANDPFVFSYDDLRGNPMITDGSQRSNAFDPEEALPTKTLRFRIKQVLSGTLTDSATPTPNTLSAGTTIDVGATGLKWTRPLNTVGRLAAFSVVALDADGVESATPVVVYFQYSKPNSAPIFTNANANPPFTGASEDVPFNITYQMLSQNYPVSDDQSGPVKYRIVSKDASCVSGEGCRLFLGSTELVDNITLPVDIGPGQTLTYVPKLYSNGVRDAFVIRALDDANELSAPQTVQVTVAAVNNAPFLDTTDKLASSVNNKSGLTIAHSDIKAKIVYKDFDAAGPTYTPADAAISYRIERVVSGTLRRTNGGAIIDPATSMPIIVSTGANGSSTLGSVYWTPAAGSTGDQVAFTIRGFDGTDYSATTTNVVVNVTAGANDKPVIANTDVTLTTGTSQNGSLAISYNTLRDSSGATDADGTPLWFRLTAVGADGSVKVGNSTYTNSTDFNTTVVYVKPGEMLGWSPNANKSGTPMAAFSVRAWDGTDLSDAITAVKVNVSAVNQAPTITQSELTLNPNGDERNTPVMISFAQIVDGLGFQDLEDAPSTDRSLLRVRIEGLVTGQGIRVGSTTTYANAVPLSGLNNVIGSTTNVFWVPPADQTGTFDAFRVTAVDTQNLSSPTMSLVKVTVTGSNAAPTMNAANKTYNIGNSPQGVPFTIKYSDLFTAFDVRDADGTYLPLVITSASNASLRKGTLALTSTTVADGTSPVSTAVIASGETIVVVPNVATSGNNTEIFKVRVWDGDKYSDPSTGVGTVQVNLIAQNQIPLLTTVKPFSGVTAGSSIDFTYDQFRGDRNIKDGSQRTDAFDAEEPVANNTLGFRVTAITSGKLYRVVGGSPTELTLGVSSDADLTLEPGETFRWEPAAGSAGTINGFAVRAWDGAALSANAIQVPFIVNPANVAPSFASAVPFTGVKEDIPFTISYNTLAANYAGSDDQATPLTYQITAISSGTLYKGATQLVNLTLLSPATLQPGELLTWIPPANQNVMNNAGAHNVIKIRLIDSAGSTSAEQQVTAVVDPTNDLPTFTSASAITYVGKTTGALVTSSPGSAFAKNTGIQINFSDISGLATDNESASNALSYRIESVNAGTLYKGTNASGSPVLPNNLVSSSMPMLVNSGANGTTTVSEVFWVPPVNASGTFTAFTIRVFDADGGSSVATKEIAFTIPASNAKPDWKASLAATLQLPSGTSQNGALPISYDTLAALTLPMSGSVVQNTDADGDVIRFRITALDSGSITLGGTTYSTVGSIGAKPALGVGESFVWRPATNAKSNPNALAAFKIELFDGQEASTSTRDITVNVSAVNQAPTIGATWTTTSVAKNVYKPITFQELAQNLNVQDLEDVDPAVGVGTRWNAMKIRIESLVNGQDIKVGSSEGAAVTLNAGNRLLDSTQNVYWLPPANQTGTFDAFRVTAVDTGSLTSAQVALVRVPVTGANAVPTLNDVSVTSTGWSSASRVMTLANSPQGVPLTISYDQLKQAFDVKDPDSSYVSLVIKSISNGTVKKGTLPMAAFDTTTNLPPNTNAVIAPNESIVFFPNGGAGVLQTLLTVQAWDGEAYSANTGDVKITLDLVNQPPVLTYVKDFSGVVRGGSLTFSYDDFRGNPSIKDGSQRTDAFDSEENPSVSKTLKFKVTAMSSGTLEDVTSGTNSISAGNAYAELAAGETWKWTPVATASGRLSAFTVEAVDAQNATSGTPITVYVNVTREPEFSGAGTPLAGASEDIPFNISYALLAANYPGFDDQATPLTYQIRSVVSGRLFKGATELVGTYTSNYPTVNPGEVLTWIPPAYVSGTLDAFTVKLVDNQGQESAAAATTVKVVVAAVNNLPVLSAGTGTLTGFTKNNGKAISFAELFKLDGTGVLKVTDFDYTNGILTDTNQVRFRIEGVPSGQLYMGSSANGTQIQPNNLNTSTMPLLVDAGANGISTTQNVFWVPPTNGVGEFTVMIVRAFDGTGYSSTTREIKVTIAPANNAPSWGAGVTALALTSGTNQNGALPVSYDTLLALAQPTDADSDIVRFQVTDVDTGTVLVNNTPYVGASLATPPSIGPGESLVWKPGNTQGSPLNAFKVKLFDGTTTSSNALQVTANVSAINQIPTMAGTFTATSTNRNVAKMISYADLRAGLVLSDAETTANSFSIKVEQLVTGQWLRIGNVTNDPDQGLSLAGAWTSSNQTLTDGKALWWMPPANQSGTFAAFRVTGIDGAGLSTANIANVSVPVTGSNASPTITAADNNLVLNKGSIPQGTPFVVTYSELQTQLNAQDSDSAYVSFVVTSISNAVIRKGSTTMAAVASSGGTLAPAGSVNIIAPDESVVVIPSALENAAPTTLFTVRAYDGSLYNVDTKADTSIKSGSVQAIFTAPTNNQVPLLSYVRDFTGASKDAVFAFTYNSLRNGGSPARTDAFDVEEALPAQSLKFKVKTIYTVNGKLCAGTDTACSGAALAADQLIESSGTNASFNWKPAAGLTGRVKAFSIVAFDGRDESLTPVDVYVQVAGENTAPVLGSVTTFAGAFEDVPFNINYDLLRTRIPATDDQSGPLSYKITDVSAGTLFKNYVTPVVAGTTTVSIGESLTWIPVQYSNQSIPAFKVKVVDAAGLESAEATATILVTAVNNPPTVTGAPTSPTAPAKNATISYSYADINALFNGKLSDPDLPGGTPSEGDISYRIESFGGAGTLTAGATAGGAVINPNGTAASMYTLMKTPRGASTNISAIFWQAPNTAGTYKLMTVRAFDGTDYAATTTDIFVTIAPSNVAPSVGSVTTITTTNGTSETAALPLSYASLHAQINATDADGDVVRYKLVSIQSGSVAVNGAAAITSVTVGSEPVLAPGQSLVWTPPANNPGTGKAAFTLKATDGSLDSSGSVAVLVNVSAVNSAPTMANTNVTFNSVTRNTAKEITHTALATALGISDEEDTNTANLNFVISAQLSGQYLRIGSSLANTTAYNPATNKVVSSTQNIYWMPPANQNGLFQAFKVVVVDTGNVSSAQEAIVSMNVDTGSNSKPVLAAGSNTFDLGSRGRGLPIQLTYDQLKAASNSSDVDNDYVSFVLTDLNNGTTIVKGAGSLVRVTVSGDSTPTPLSNNLISPNETITVYPAPGITLNSLQDLFKFRAWDGQVYSVAGTEVTVKATFTTVNSVPTLSYVRDFTTGTKDTAFVFSYDDLRGDPTIINGTQRSDAYDAEEVLANKTLNFLVKSVNSNGFLCLSSALTCDGTTSDAERIIAGEYISNGSTYKWVPPAGATGRVNAFDVVVHDGTAESATTIPVYVWLKPTNTTPSISSSTPIPGAVEDVPFAISWDTLRANYPYSDDQSGPVKYKITAVTTGVLRMNGALVTAGVTQVGITDRLEWTPASNASGTLNAFSVKPIDDNGSEPGSATQVQVIVAAVNDIPVVTSAPSALPGISKNTAQTYTYANIDSLFSGKISDVDGGTISYRIERVLAGTLYSGSTNAGAVINPTSSASMYTLVNALGSQTNPTTSVYWEPPANAEGTFTIMTVRPFDGTDYANTAWNISVTITGSNAAPTWSATLVPSYSSTLPTAVAENGALPISYSTLSTAAPASDVDGQIVKYRITEVLNGTLTVGGVAYTSASALPANTFLSVGESMLWSPAADDATSPRAAFKVAASDGSAETSDKVTVNVNVNAVNSAPSIAGPYTVTGVSRNAWKEVTHANLISYLGASDAPGETPAASLILQVEALTAGQSLKIGTSGNEAGAAVYSGTNKRVTTGNSIYWLPATNQTGIVDAIRFTAIDGGNVSSPTQGLLRMNIDTGSNTPPNINSGNYSLGASYGLGLPFTVSYSTLQTALSATDPDGAYASLVLTSISNGSIKKGSTVMSPMTGASQANPVTPNTNSQLVPGESWVFFPTTTTTGSAVTLATLRAWDGTTYSSNEVTLQATFVAGLNQVPVLTFVKNFTGGQKNTAFSFTYDSLRGNPALMSQGTERTDAFDAEEVITNKTLQFRVEAVTASSTLTRTAGGTLGAVNAGGFISKDESFTWTPPSNVTGLQNAFTIVVWDGAAASATPVQVKVYINADPVFTNSSNVISGVVENTPYTITYDKLFTTFPSSDDSTGILGYQISDLTGATGTLQRYVNGVATNVTAPYTMYPGDQVMWTPPLYQNINTVPLHQLFKLRLVDSEGATSNAIDVKATVSAVNTPPVALTSTAVLSSVARNVSGGKTITYADIFNAIDFREYDVNTSAKPGINDPHGIKFRIESVNSGTLRATTNLGTVINPNPADPTTMKFHVQAGADNTTSWTQLNWTPPVGALGTYTIMRVRLYDGTDFSNTVVNVNVEVTSGNTAPVASGFTVTPGTSENGAQLFTYDTLMALSGATDAENDPITFKITQLSTGSVVYKGTTYLTTGSAIPTPPVVAPGDSFMWRPAANASGLALSAFRFKPTDTITDGSEAQVNVDVAGYNSAPTMLPAYTYTGATRYPNSLYFEISHASLLTNLSAQDTENVGTLLTFKIEELLGGQGAYITTSGQCATVPAQTSFYPSLTTLTNGQSICWIQPSGVIGTYEAMRLSVIDADNAVGGIQARVSVTISSGADSTPAYYGAYTTPNYYVVKSGGTVSWTYEQLKNLSGAYDSDTSAVSLVITSINANLVSANGGTLTKNGANVAAWTGTLGTSYSSNIPSSSMVIAPGEKITYQASSGGGVAMNTPTQLFKFAAMDSSTVAATDKAVNVELKPNNNENPTFSYIAPILIQSKTNGVAVTIPYIQFRTHANAHDLDEPVDATAGIPLSLKFQISSVGTTHGTLQISKGGAACSAITAGTTQLEPGDSICFTPNATTAGQPTATILSTNLMELKPINYNSTTVINTPVNLQIRLP